MEQCDFFTCTCRPSGGRRGKHFGERGLGSSQSKVKELRSDPMEPEEFASGIAFGFRNVFLIQMFYLIPGGPDC